MSTTITATSTGGTTTPLLVNGYEAARQSRNIIHDLLSDGIAVTLINPRPRSGTLRLLYDDEAAAFAALNLHAEETTFAIVSDERAGVGMIYVLDGDVSIALDEETQTAWIVSVGFQEVTA